MIQGEGRRGYREKDGKIQGEGWRRYSEQDGEDTWRRMERIQGEGWRGYREKDGGRIKYFPNF